MRRRQGQFWKQSQILMIVFAVALVVAAAGCGGKKKASTTTTTTTTTAAATTTTTTTAATTAATSTTTATSSTSSDNTLGALASAANCKSIANIGQAFAQAIQGTNGDVGKDAQLFQQFADKTPSDIRPAFETVAEELAKVAEALKGVNLKAGATPDAATIAKLEQLASEVNTPALTKADSQIAAWAAANCHA